MHKHKYKNFIDFLPGHKTYIIILGAVLVNAFYIIGMFNESTMEVINTSLGFLGLGTIALKLDRVHVLIGQKVK